MKTQITHHYSSQRKTQNVSDMNCYESPKQEKVSHAFEHLIQNLKAYSGVRI